MSAIRRLLAMVSLSLFLVSIQAQPLPGSGETKPYKVLTSGKQITIKSDQVICHVMVWTAGGDRVVEQKDINASSYRIDLPVNQKQFFLMILLKDGRRFTERIGLR